MAFLATVMLGSLLALAPQEVLDPANKDVTSPKLIHSVDPVAPSRLFGGKKHVVIECTVDEQGDVSAAKVTTSAGKKYDEAALTAVRQYKFEPASKDGKPLAVQLFVDVTFQYGGHR